MSSPPTLEHIQTFGRAVADYLSAHRPHLNGFNWPIEPQCVQEAMRRELLLDLTVDGGFAETMRLRKAVSLRAGEIQARVQQPRRAEELTDLADFVIAHWGNLKGNKPQTIADYAERFTGIKRPFAEIGSAAQLRDAVLKQNRRGLFRFTGIASWSKWLNFVWNDWALIYDARIAFALDAIHFLHEVDAPVFPVPTGRNQTLANLDAESSAAFRWVANYGAECLPGEDMSDRLAHAMAPEKDTYCYYLAVMEAAHQFLWPAEERHPLVHTEMLLFMLSVNVIANDFARAMLAHLGSRTRAAVEIEQILETAES